jgi:uncharacterized protein (TIRG00374 family)
LKITTFELFKVNLSVKFYLLFLPGAIVGSGIRWAKVTSEGKSAEALAAVGFNRVVETYFIVVTGFFWYFLGLREQNIHLGVIALFLVTIGAFWLIFIVISRRATAWFKTLDGRNLRPRLRRIWHYIQRIMESINLYTALKPHEWLTLFEVSILVHLIGLVSYSLVARSSGIDISIINLAWTQAVIQLASLTPLSMAGGLGIREISLVVLLPIYGVSSETALAFSLLLLVRNIVLSLIGGLSELVDLLRIKSGIGHKNPRSTREDAP